MGHWTKVPSLRVNGQNLIVKGKWVKTAAVHDEDWLDTEIGDPEVYIQKLKTNGSGDLRADLFTFTQKLPQTTPRFKYSQEWDSIAATRTSNFKEWWEKLPQETRKNVRRSAKRGIVIRSSSFDDALINGIMEINNESEFRQGKRSRDFGKTFDQVKRDHSAFLDRCDFIGAYSGDELAGFLKIVYRGEIASILQLLVKAKHSDKRPANALFARAVELCSEKGLQYLTYGMYNYGNKHDSPIRQFKIRNGLEEVLVPRYYVPLTWWGALCMKMRLHRGLLWVLPPGVIAGWFKARSRWYEFSQPNKPV